MSTVYIEILVYTKQGKGKKKKKLQYIYIYIYIPGVGVVQITALLQFKEVNNG